ncbi:tyrosine-type recombinase/integrase [Nocardia sp. NPDC050630]|uniref:tyrosine-type recombinase/integrase n=1 Tax=Nocardia sp. NPDC050630 TaxID=3364321 RepID=UPI00379B4F0F
MNTLRQTAEDYLELRRSLGFGLIVPGRQVLQFADYLDRLGATRVTPELAIEWATQAAGTAAYYQWLRLSAVRGFAHYLHGIDPAHQVPTADLLPRDYHRPTPYLLSAADITSLIAATATLRPELHAATYRTLIGLLAVTGMRPSEALTMDTANVDLREGILTVRGKYDKTREILIHPSTITELADYTALRDRTFPCRTDTSFFVSLRGTALNKRRVHYVFTRLATRAGLLPHSPRCRPVLTSLRHSFAVATLISWYHDGVDIDAHMPLLSTWMGHVDPADTYWYISATPELLALATERMVHTFNDTEEAR